MFIPKLMLQQLYTIGSLRLNKNGIQFSLKNRLKDVSLRKIKTLKVNQQLIDAESIHVSSINGNQMSAADIEQSNGLKFILGAEIEVFIDSIKMVCFYLSYII